jgi:hypothetical protein
MEAICMGTVAMGRPRKLNREIPPPTISMKGDQEWVEWVDELGKFINMNRSKLIEYALVEVARTAGFKKAAPPRFKAK